MTTKLPSSVIVWLSLLTLWSFISSPNTAVPDSVLALAPPPPPPLLALSFVKKIEDDFGALTRRVTAHHILLPSEEPVQALRQKIRDECISQERFIVDVFEDAATKYSRDPTTKEQGGLLGVLVPQGYCRSPQLDRSCFEVPLGQMSVIETDFGWHLLLVSERTNCPKLDGSRTKLIQTRGDDVFGTLSSTSGKQAGSVDVADILIKQVGFWMACFVAGGILAELAEKLVPF